MNKHIGSTFDDWMKENGITAEDIGRLLAEKMKEIKSKGRIRTDDPKDWKWVNPPEEKVKTPSRVLRLNDVKKITGLSRSSIYLKMTKGEFPKKISLGHRCVGWIEDEVNEWVEKRIATSRGSHDKP